MNESEYLVVSNKAHLQDAKSAMRECVLGYGIEEKEYQAVMRLLSNILDKLYDEIVIDEEVE